MWMRIKKYSNNEAIWKAMKNCVASKSKVERA